MSLARWQLARALLVPMLGSDRADEQILGRALVSRWYEREGDAWVNEMFAPPLSDNEGRVSSVLLGLPFGRTTWARVIAAGDAVERRYWEELRVRLLHKTSIEDIGFAVEGLLGARRAVEALNVIGLFLARLPGQLAWQNGCIRTTKTKWTKARSHRLR